MIEDPKKRFSEEELPSVAGRSVIQPQRWSLCLTSNMFTNMSTALTEFTRSSTIITFLHNLPLGDFTIEDVSNSVGLLHKVNKPIW